MSIARRAIIIGGGVAGPSTALFLKKIGYVPIIYESHSHATNIGGGLGIAPNGMHVLSQLGLAERISSRGAPAEYFSLTNQTGKVLANAPAGSKKRYGYPCILMRRSLLYDTLMESVQENGIKVEFNKNCVAVETDEKGKTVVKFSDGTSDSADIILGCDGVKSKVRDFVLTGKENVKPVYTGLYGTGGFISADKVPAADPNKEPACVMARGPKGFFGYGYIPHANEWMWWSNFEASEEHAQGYKKTTKGEVKAELIRRHGDWKSPIPEIIEASSPEVINWPIYDLSSIPTWHRNNAVLLGDAAHTTSPNSGQGASMALEDSVAIAKALLNYDDIEMAFKEFENMRRDRTEKIVRDGRRRGNQKKDMGPIASWFQDNIIKYYFRLAGEGVMDEIYGYRIDLRKEK